MAETKKTTTKKTAAKKTTTARKTTSTAAKKTTTAKRTTVAKKPVTRTTTAKKAPVKRQSSNISNADKSFKVTNDTAMFGVWVDALILVFVVVMFALILYGYVMAA